MGKSKCLFCGSVLFRLRRHLKKVHNFKESECDEILKKNRMGGLHHDNDEIIQPYTRKDLVLYTRSKTPTPTPATDVTKRCRVERVRYKYMESDGFDANRLSVVPVKKSFPYSEEFCEKLAMKNKPNRVKEIMCFIERLWGMITVRGNRGKNNLFSSTAVADGFLHFVAERGLAPASKRCYGWHTITYLKCVRELEGDLQKTYTLSMTIEKLKVLCNEYRAIIKQETFINTLKTGLYFIFIFFIFTSLDRTSQVFFFSFQYVPGFGACR